MTTRQVQIGQHTLSFETGKLAKQADGSVIVRVGDTLVLVTACHAANAREGIDFLPLTVDYREYTYASGRIPGGFFKREGKATEKETLTSRVIDRPIRPLFPAGWSYETQVIAFVLSADTENDSDVLALTGAGAALALSEMPVEKTVAAVRVGLVDGQFIVNPTFPQRKQSKIDLVVAGTKDGIVMVEAGANEVTEDEAVTALETAHNAIKQLVDMIDTLAKEAGRPKLAKPEVKVNAELKAYVDNSFTALADAMRIKGKLVNYATVATADDQQKIEMVDGETWKRFMLHYNFPPFSVGEVKPMRGPGRREIGHGALAERALAAMMPPESEFAYTVRIVSDILESNGSSSMASVCGASLAMMDAGVPIKAPVAGMAMGLIMDEATGKYAVLSDIAGAEDHYGDMDFKVAGTAAGITALQMDIKVAGITMDVMRQALQQAHAGRVFILDKMQQTLPASRSDVSSYAPRIVTIRIPVDKIRDVIGPGGKTIRSIIERTGVKIDVEDDGRVNVASADEASARKAISMIQELTATPELNKVYVGKVQRITDFGAFVEIMPGTDGLLHVSEIANHRVKDVRDELKEGEQVVVKVINIDPTGKIRLSRKALLNEAEGAQAAAQGAAKPTA